MSGRRRRDGEPNQDDGVAQAVGRRSSSASRGRKRGDAPAGAGDRDAPRVHGAWTTPAVVVRRPDGSIVNDDERPTTGAGAGRRPTGAAASRRGAASRPGPEAPPKRRSPRLRPRRIPGAPGAVLLTPTLSDAQDGREERRRRRNAAAEAAVTPLPPRPSPQADATDTADRAGPPTDEAEPARPSLRAISGAATKGTGRRGARRSASTARGSRGPSPSRPGERRRQRVLQAVAGLNFDRLLPADDEARERRAARLRRIGTRLGAVALAVLLVYGVFPVRTWIDQRAATQRLRERDAVFDREIEVLLEEERDLNRDERIEEEAREMGMVMPGEESYGILPAPEPAAPPEPTSTTQPGG